MRLAVVNHEYPPLGGGAATACEALARALARRGHELLVVTSAAPGCPPREERDNLVVVRLADGRRSRVAPKPFELLSFYFRARWQLPEILRGFRSDGILAFLAVPGGAAAVATARRFRVPCVVSLRGSDVPGFSSQRLAAWQRLALRPWVRRTLLGADAVAPNNQHLYDLAVHFEPRIRVKTSVVPNGVDPTTIAARPAQSGTGELRLVTVAQFIPRKQLHLAIETVRTLSDAGLPVRLTLAGEGPQEQVLRRLAGQLGVAERVDFIGHQPRTEMAQLLRRQDVCLVTSRAEGASNVILEAMAAGLPIVTTRNGAQDLVLDAGCGTVVDAAEPRSLVDALCALLADERRRSRLAEAGLRYAKSHTWQHSAERLEAILLGLKAGYSGPPQIPAGAKSGNRADGA